MHQMEQIPICDVFSMTTREQKLRRIYLTKGKRLHNTKEVMTSNVCQPCCMDTFGLSINIRGVQVPWMGISYQIWYVWSYWVFGHTTFDIIWNFDMIIHECLLAYYAYLFLYLYVTVIRDATSDPINSVKFLP